jgi:hypothetical protein
MKKKLLFFATAVLISVISVFAQCKTDSCEIVVLANPPEAYQHIIGGGKFLCGEILTVCIFPPLCFGYELVNWTIDSIEISTDACCTFTATPSCTLVANFVKKTDVTEAIETSIIDFYPNPTAGELRITGYELQINDVEIYDIFGRKMFEEKGEGRKEKKIDISDLPARVYYVKITTEKGIIVKKIVKQ